MKKVLLIISVFIICKNTIGQFNFRSTDYLSKKVDFIPDSILENKHLQTNSYVDSLFDKQKNFSFQFRYWKQGTTTLSTTVFILTLEDKKWNAKCYLPNSNWQTDKKYFREINVDATKLDQLWELLVNNNILTLPTESKLKDKMVKYTIDTTNLSIGQIQHLEMTDGILYNFQLINFEGTKTFSYSCPQLHLKHFGNVQEFYNASVIILLLKKYLGLSDIEC